MLKQLTLAFAFLLITVLAIAQKTFSISGIVKDKKETLPGASIYLSGYKAATTTDPNGRFVLNNLAPGNYDVLVQMIGYTPISKNVVISDQSANITIVLIANTTTLNEVVIKPDPNRPYHISLFKKFFIGETPNAEKCRILNTNALVIDDDKATGLLTIKANEMLIIENQALGYRIKYLLDVFEYDYRNRIIYYAGQPAFEEMKGGAAKQKRWSKEREIAFQGSSDHFFQSLVKNELAQEGFQLFKIAEKKNPSRPSDSLISAKVRQFSTAASSMFNISSNLKSGTVTKTNHPTNDSLSYWLNKRREPKTFRLLNKRPVLVDTLVKEKDDLFKTLRFEDDLYVVFKNEKEPTEANYSTHKQARPLDIGDAQVSIVKLIGKEILLYKSGAVATPRNILYSGLWGYQKVADTVPLDYISIKKKP